MARPARYTVVWQKCDPDNGIAQRFHVPGYEGHLPFFLWGEELEAFESRGEVELREEHLLKGILYGLSEFDNDPKPWHREEDKKTLLYLLDVLGNGFGFADPETMVLDVAASLREEIGSVGSRIVLEVGKGLIPPRQRSRAILSAIRGQSLPRMRGKMSY
jgi:hypothetical protein